MAQNQQITGNIGLFWACYKLTCLGWNAMPTSRNARGIDIVCFSTDGGKMVTVQVKTISKRGSVPLGDDLAKLSDMVDWWVVVNDAATSAPRSFILRASEVKKLALRRERDGRVSYWVPSKCYSSPGFYEQWDRIGPPPNP